MFLVGEPTSSPTQNGAHVARIVGRSPRNPSSINFLDCWTTCTPRGWSCAWHATFWHVPTASCLVNLHHDGVNHTFKLLLLRLKFILLGELILIKPIEGILHGLFDVLLVPRFKLIFQFLLAQCIAHREAIILQTIFCLDFLFGGLILRAVLLCFLHHTVNLSLRQSPFFICDGD